MLLKATDTYTVLCDLSLTYHVCVGMCRGRAHGQKTTWSWFVPSTVWFLEIEFSLGGKCSYLLSHFTAPRLYILWHVDQILISSKF